MWDEVNEGYATNVNSLMVNHNRITITAHANPNIGEKPHLSYDWAPFVIKNALVTAPHTDSDLCDIHTTSEHVLHGCVAQEHDKKADLAVPPLPLFKHFFVQAAARSHINLHLHWHPSSTTKPSEQPLYLKQSYDSPPLVTILVDMLNRSDNLIAEALFKKLGQHFFHAPGSWLKGRVFAHTILSTWAETKHLTMADGSGLSRYNALSAAQIGHLITLMYQNIAMRHDLLVTLPQIDHHAIYAKTGSMTGVKNLAGIINPNSKHPIAFVLMFNQINSAQQAQQVNTAIHKILEQLTTT